MKKIELNLEKTTDDVHHVYAKDINQKIEINRVKKETDNIREFFRLIIFKMFEEKEKYTVELSKELKKYDNAEVIVILSEMIQICNAVDLEVEAPEVAS